jgi:hypothetical protein
MRQPLNVAFYSSGAEGGSHARPWLSTHGYSNHGKPLPVLHQLKAALNFPTMSVSFYTKFTPNKKRESGVFPNSPISLTNTTVLNGAEGGI